ncbi:MAG: anaerobic ribonucleoside-triphosphate reductase activating protein [Lachnospiraceae bacterium]|nr:anaerobic ribonucleoside-triphosphate reductase activating protein [Lachnospiraceae bacterium]
MNYADIKQYDVANGPGVRVSLFVSGCTHHCKECFNPETWDFGYGKPFTEETIKEIIGYLEPSYIKGLTLLGGDPLEHCNQIALLPLVKRVKEVYPEKNLWCYTGYDFEKDVKGYMMKEWEGTRELLSYIDVLVDGEFEIEKKNLKLAFRGSSNQRIILVQESLEKGQLKLWHSAYEKEIMTKEKQYFFINRKIIRRPKEEKTVLVRENI